MTAVQISENIHLLITKKRTEIIERYGKRFDMKDIADVAIKEGIGKVEEKLGLSDNVQK